MPEMGLRNSRGGLPRMIAGRRVGNPSRLLRQAHSIRLLAVVRGDY